MISVNKCKRLKEEYESGKTSHQLALKYHTTPGTVCNWIRKAGGSLRTAAEGKLKFSMTQCCDMKVRYEKRQSLSLIGRDYKVCPLTIARAVIRAGGTIRSTNDHQQKYFRNPLRERSLMCAYRLSVEDMDFLLAKQKKKCLWCKAKLPTDSLRCVVDHIGGYKTYGNRNRVRGLCCPNGACNRFAGYIERSKIIKSSGGLLRPLIRHVKSVLRRNHGNIKFPNRRK